MNIKLRMDELKQDPREIPEIKYLLEKAQRLYEEGNQMQRQFLEEEIYSFNDLLDRASIIDCKKAAAVFSIRLDRLEKSMFSFDNEAEDLWKQYIEENMENKDPDKG